MNAIKTIWFDMDGTIAELYKVPGWLEMLRTSDWRVYDKCLPRAHFDRINSAIEALTAHGWQVGVITWASKGIGWGMDCDCIGDVKFNWLNRYFPALADGKFACIPYGESKAQYLLDMENAGEVNYLVDDNKEVREDWRAHSCPGCVFKTINATRPFHRDLEGLVM